MKSTFAKNRTEQMPIYNRSYGHGRLSDDGDIVLTTHKRQIFLEREIKSEDTLQSIALEFNVPVAELKRINNIHKENEIHARKVIKIPSNPLSLLLEKEYFVETQNHAPQDPGTSEESCDVILDTVNNSSCNSRVCDESAPEEVNSKYLLNPVKTDELLESVSLLPTVELRTSRQTDVISCNGADWGISWPMLLVLTLTLGVVGPVIYVFWFLMGKPEKPEGS